MLQENKHAINIRFPTLQSLFYTPIKINRSERTISIFRRVQDNPRNWIEIHPLESNKKMHPPSPRFDLQREGAPSNCRKLPRRVQDITWSFLIIYSTFAINIHARPLRIIAAIIAQIMQFRCAFAWGMTPQYILVSDTMRLKSHRPPIWDSRYATIFTWFSPLKLCF